MSGDILSVPTREQIGAKLTTLLNEYRDACQDYGASTYEGDGWYAAQIAQSSARAKLDAALDALTAKYEASARDAERLDVLDSLDTDALAMVTGRALDGDSLRYLADVEIEQRARAATREEGTPR